jgi:hypothetical protein
VCSKRPFFAHPAVIAIEIPSDDKNNLCNPECRNVRTPVGTGPPRWPRLWELVSIYTRNLA